MPKILLVDDEPDIILTTRMILEKEGYEVVIAESGIECLDKMSKENPDLVLLDIMMRKMNGWEVGRQIKENNETKHIPVIMFTVRTSDDSRTKSFEYSKADAQIDKPFSREELLGTIEQVLKKSSLRE